MHISEGILSTPTLVAGVTCALIGVTIGLKALKEEKLPLAALFGALFFMASTIHVHVGISSTHLILNGLAGLFLGWAVFPVFLISLMLQAFLFSFGGLTVLGVNLCIMALPAVVVYYLLRGTLKRGITRKKLIAVGLIGGFLGVFLGAIFESVVLALDGGKDYINLIGLIFIASIPVFILDSLISVAILLALLKLKPSFIRDVFVSGQPNA